MIYFSELRGKKVLTEDGIRIGKLDDIIFSATTSSFLTKLIVVDNRKEDKIIPIKYLKRITNNVIINKAFSTSILEADELYILKNLLDKQIIDLKGHKVVRVNDVILQEKGEEDVVSGTFYISGVDIGLVGILRWFKLDKLFNKISCLFKIKYGPEFLSWADIQLLELVRGSVKLKKTGEKLIKVRPEDLADYLERTTVNNIKKILNILDKDKAIQVISNLNLSLQDDLFKKYHPEKVAEILTFIDPDDATDILLTLKHKKREEILKLLPVNTKKNLEYLLSISVTHIGNLITTEFITVSPNDSVQDVLNKIKKNTLDFSYLSHIYVVNTNNQLIGVFNLHELLLADSGQFVYKFMIQNMVVVHLNTPLEIVYKKMFKYKLHVLPVVDESKKIIGIITVMDVINKMLTNKK